jgi:hypothetical protein
MTAAGMTKAVTFETVERSVNELVDDAYREVQGQSVSPTDD